MLIVLPPIGMRIDEERQTVSVLKDLGGSARIGRDSILFGLEPVLDCYFAVNGFDHLIPR